MLDRPDAAELMEALAAFLEEDVVPAFQGGRRFHALVAANVARILAREMRIGPRRIAAEISDVRGLLGTANETSAARDAGVHDQAAQLAPATEPPSAATDEAGGSASDLLLGLARELCERIERGELDEDPRRSELIEFLKRSIARRLEIDSPTFAR